MCGICGVYNYQKNDEVTFDLLKKMTASLQHRGPDDEGIWLDVKEGIGLGHRRLSIIDLTTGQQPMSNADKSIWLVFNGEIYNFPELKKELQRKGIKFHTTSDTEVIIYAYQEWGVNAFSRLNGIFAFAIYDCRNRSVILVRDQFGVKPIYYALHQGTLLFGSELKSILEFPNFPRSLSTDALNSFLTFRYNPSPQTMFNGIQKLEPGYYIRVDEQGTIEKTSYWNYQPVTNEDITEVEAIAEYQHLLEKVVSSQMISDVPVGLLLSGGIDSAVIGRLMQQVASKPIKTFTVGFSGRGDYNELDDAKKTAEYIGSEHYELVISQKEYFDFFLQSFTYTEEPIAETTIPALYYITKLAASHLKVVLAGQGADEPLAGYQRYFGEQMINRYRILLRLLPLQLISHYVPRNERFKRAVYASRFQDELKRFVGIYTIFTPAQKQGLMLLSQFDSTIDESMVARLHLQTNGLKDSLSRLLYIDTRLHLADNLLLFGDKMSMANSLEMRVPFLDIQLVTFLESLPASMKLRGKTHKYIHKKALHKWLPQDIIHRKKRGFQTPMDEWLQNDLAVTARRLFVAPTSACRTYFHLDYVMKMLDAHIARHDNFMRQIFALLSFEIWYQKFFENKDVKEL
ncbi:asparagine synthase (glutamine-hydrolyzing) [candidate division KSB1 bacterium]|nr:asparagine synthase (glutamine-hydrolyzing) [candidate division KSB1 bacterium]